ncbi:hypothetical protein DL98DRAFT_509726 [Cadophora sp. DSE1049]|nr:hypothetical protein DL98DRAFT_509726 [Cadophora sp. DSE1049]
MPAISLADLFLAMNLRTTTSPPHHCPLLALLNNASQTSPPTSQIHLNNSPHRHRLPHPTSHHPRRAECRFSKSQPKLGVSNRIYTLKQ